MSKRYLALCVFGFLLVWSACRKKYVGDTGPAGPQGSAYSGVIAGYIHVYDQSGKPVTTGLNTVQLTLKGGRTVNADDSGHYVFDKVGAGNYYLTVSGAGLATTMVGNVNVIKDTTQQNILISQAPTARLINLSKLSIPSNYPYISYSAQFDSSATLFCWILFLDNQPDVSNTRYKLAYKKRNSISFFSQMQIMKADLADAGILWGDTLYVAAYAYVGTDSSKYVDVTTGKTIYTAVGGAPLYDTTSAP